MKKLIGIFKTYTIRGALAVIPLGLAVLVVRFLYKFVDRQVALPIEGYVGIKLPGLGIVLVLVLLFLTGLVVSNVLGKQIFILIERMTSKIPLVRSAYQVGKQLSDTLSLPEKQVFKKAVLVEYLKEGSWTVGFVTGYIRPAGQQEKLLKVFIPTPPNPLSGTMVIVRESQIWDPGWTIEEATRTIISGGIIGPDTVAEKKV